MSLLQEHNEQIALATGNVIKFDLIGGSSFELAGKVDFSIWNRNAKTNMDAKYVKELKFNRFHRDNARRI